MINIMYHKKNITFINQINYLRVSCCTIDHYFLASKELEKIGARGIFLYFHRYQEKIDPMQFKEKTEDFKSFKFRYDDKTFKFYSINMKNL